MQGLRPLCLLTWLVLTVLQFALPWLASDPPNLWLLLLAAPLLVPLHGMLVNKRYTYKWLGFLTLLYFCVGISELVSNPALRLYGFGTTFASTLLFFASIYQARFLAHAERQ